MRRALFVTIALLTVASVQSLALQVHPRPPFRGFGRPPQAAVPPQAGQEPAIIDASSLGSPLVLDKSWRVGISSDTKAASAEFDDSRWAVRDGKGTIADVAEPGEDSDHPDHEDKYAWFRLHLKLAPNHGPVALLIELPVSQSTPLNNSSTGPGADVYANGKLILPEGPHPDETFKYQQISRLYKLNISGIRNIPDAGNPHLYVPFGLKGYTNFFYNRTLRLGNPEDLNRDLKFGQ